MLAHGDGKKVKLARLHPTIVCGLCRGYLIDATTVTECLHSFCRSCLLKHLDTKDDCPNCDTKVYKVLPSCNIRQDGILQDLVYKLVPGLFQNEIQRRLKFIQKHREGVVHQESDKVSGENASTSQDERSTSSGRRDNRSSVPLSPSMGPNCTTDVSNPVSVQLSLHGRRPGNTDNHEAQNVLDVRYLSCPEELTVGHLKKFVHLKFTLKSYFQVEFYHKGQRLLDQLTLKNVGGLYDWKQNAPLTLDYTVFDPISVLLHPRPRKSPVLHSTLADLQNEPDGQLWDTKDSIKENKIKTIKGDLSIESVICKQEVNIGGVSCKVEDVKFPRDVYNSTNNEKKVVPTSQSKTLDSAINRLSNSKDSQTNSISHSGQKNNAKIAPKIVIRRKRRREKPDADAAATPRTHKNVKKSKLAVCKVTENGKMKLIISNPRTDLVKRKLLACSNEPDVSASCPVKSPRVIASSQQNENIRRLAGCNNSSMTAVDSGYLSAAAAAGIACVTSMSSLSSSPLKTLAPIFTVKTTEALLAGGNGFRLDNTNLSVEQNVASKGPESSKEISSEGLRIYHDKRELNVTQCAENQVTAAGGSSSESPSEAYSNGILPAAEAGKHTHPQKTSANSINEEKCSPIIPQISITKSGDEKQQGEAGGVHSSDSPYFLSTSAVKLEKVSLITPVEENNTHLQCSATSAEQITPSVNPTTSSVNTFSSSPLHIKTDLSKTLFERILDEFSPKKEMKEASFAGDCEKISQAATGIMSTHCDKKPEKLPVLENAEAKFSENNNHKKYKTCHRDNNNKVARELFTKAKTSLFVVKSGVKCVGATEVKTEQLDTKATGCSSHLQGSGDRGVVIKSNNKTRQQPESRGEDEDDEQITQRTSDDNDIEGLAAFNVPKPLAIEPCNRIINRTGNHSSTASVVKTLKSQLQPTLNSHCRVTLSEKIGEYAEGSNNDIEASRSEAPSQTEGHSHERVATDVAGKTSNKSKRALSPGNKTFRDKESPAGLSLSECQQQGPLKINVRWDRKEQVYVSQGPNEVDLGGKKRETEIASHQKGRQVTEDSSSSESGEEEEGALIIDETAEATSSLTGETRQKSCDGIKSMGSDRLVARLDSSTCGSTSQPKEVSYSIDDGTGFCLSADNNEAHTKKTATEGQLQIDDAADRVPKLNNGGSYNGLASADNEGIINGEAAASDDLSEPNGITLSPLRRREETTLCEDQCREDERDNSASLSEKGNATVSVTNSSAAKLGSCGVTGSYGNSLSAASHFTDTHSCQTESPPHAKIKRITETKRVGDGCHGNLKVVFSLIPKQPKSVENVPSKTHAEKLHTKFSEKLEKIKSNYSNKSISRDDSTLGKKTESSSALVLKTPSVQKKATVSKDQIKKLKRRHISSVFGLDQSQLPSCPSVNVTPLGMFASPRVRNISTPCESTPVSTPSEIYRPASSPSASSSFSETPLTSRKTSITLDESFCGKQEKTSGGSNSKVLLSVPDCSKLTAKSRSTPILTVPSNLCTKAKNAIGTVDSQALITNAHPFPSSPVPNCTTTCSVTDFKSISLQQCTDSVAKGISVPNCKTAGKNGLITNCVSTEKKSTAENNTPASDLCEKRWKNKLTKCRSIGVSDVDSLCPPSEPSAVKKQVELSRNSLSIRKADLITSTATQELLSKPSSHSSNPNKLFPLSNPEQLRIPRVTSSNGTITSKSLPFPAVTKDTTISTDTGVIGKSVKKTAGYMVKPKQLFEAIKSRQLKQKTSENKISVLPFPGRQKLVNGDHNPSLKNPTGESDKTVSMNLTANSKDVLNLNKLPKSSHSEDKHSQSKPPVTASKLKTLADIGKLANPPEEEVSPQSRNPVLPSNATTTPPLMLTPGFYGAPYLPFAPHFTGTYIHPMLPLMMGLDRATDDLYLQRASLYEQSHLTNLYDRYYAAHSPSIFPIRCLEDGTSSHASRIEAPLDFSTRGIAHFSNGEVMKKPTSLKDSHLEVKK